MSFGELWFQDIQGQSVVSVEGRVRPRWGKAEVLKSEDLAAP